MSPRTLFDDAVDSKLWRAFREFHAKNPHVYEMFERFALEAVETGRARIGARMIWNRMRWYCRFETTDKRAGRFKLNDHHSPYYARLFLERHPQHAGLFETRRVQGEVG